MRLPGAGKIAVEQIGRARLQKNERGDAVGMIVTEPGAHRLQKNNRQYRNGYNPGISEDVGQLFLEAHATQDAIFYTAVKEISAGNASEIFKGISKKASICGLRLKNRQATDIVYLFTAITLELPSPAIIIKV